ncbi:MAG: aldo/keto reductase [bacterium]
MATPQATEQYFQRLSHKSLHPDAVGILGKTEFRVSAIGFGGYRIHHNSVEHARALRYALLNGINLIDTSSNYTDGGSEMLVGNLLQEMFERGEVARDEVVVVSKVGYVQGQNLTLARQLEARDQPFPEMVPYLDDCWHCIHPDFLQDQLTRSLDRLRLPSLDVYLLHNPEYFLSDARKRGSMDAEAARDAYYRRIKHAFEWLEEKVQEGKIKAYGISSNTFPASERDFEFTSLEKLLQIAASVSPQPYFQVIQFPFNLFEIGAHAERNQSDGTKTLLQLAAENRVATLANRPLNAMANGGMIRLASFRESDEQQIRSDFSRQIQELRVLEQKFKQELIAKAPADMPRGNLQTVFSVAQHLAKALVDFENWEHWDHVKQNYVLPQSLAYLSYLNRQLSEDRSWQAWYDAYVHALHRFLDTVSKHYENQAQARSNAFAQKLDNLNDALRSSETLSQKALRILTSTDGIDCVLLGMRKTPYVEDALSALGEPSLSQVATTLQQFSK